MDKGLKEEPPYQFQNQGGEGVGSCEVPRGTLFHNYIINDDGSIQGANCIIPTGQNCANMEADMRALVPLLAQALKILPPEVIIFSVQPADIEWKSALNPAVEACIPH